MKFITEERLKEKYLEQILKLVRSNRSMAAPESNVKPEEWNVYCSAQIECLVETVLDLVKTAISEMEEAESAPPMQPKKIGNYKGTVVDGSVVNGDYV